MVASQFAPPFLQLFANKYIRRFGYPALHLGTNTAPLQPAAQISRSAPVVFSAVTDPASSQGLPEDRAEVSCCPGDERFPSTPRDEDKTGRQPPINRQKQAEFGHRIGERLKGMTEVSNWRYLTAITLSHTWRCFTELVLTSQLDRFQSMPVTSSLISFSGVFLRSLIRAGTPPAFFIARLFSSFCRPYDRFLTASQHLCQNTDKSPIY